MAQSRLCLHKHIRRLHDPRLNRRKRPLLADILSIAVGAVLAGANTWPDIETFARHLRACLRPPPAPSLASRPVELAA